MNLSRRSIFQNMPPVVKNLIIINIIMLLATFVFRGTMHIDLTRVLGLFYFESSNFRPYQLISHIFMHGGIAHLFFNMFALFMFGRILEQVWGSKRFFIYYFFTGLGAAALHSLVNFIEVKSVMSNLTPEQIALVKSEGVAVFEMGKNYAHQGMAALNIMLNIPTVGASGAVFGLLLAFGMYFPNTELMIMFIPVPIKAKYFVIGYGLIELFLGFSQPNSGVAHFAHLGGMLFGFILIKVWKKQRNNFY
ncbi:MAG: rhomboid family intramembrane serine protease [Bacteroidales bacterium]|nr:rhomboid family intramembrane serine protease [Bacteroidales bacterium]MDD4673047.1 rhomboid family intramembrane serine protease [Bacteroidales bacterium]MDY0349090.1 rhomboid family intramembrane serine protease [Tenuifilaceae bacterium]